MIDRNNYVYYIYKYNSSTIFQDYYLILYFLNLRKRTKIMCFFGIKNIKNR